MADCALLTRRRGRPGPRCHKKLQGRARSGQSGGGPADAHPQLAHVREARREPVNDGVRVLYGTLFGADAARLAAPIRVFRRRGVRGGS